MSLDSVTSRKLLLTDSNYYVWSIAMEGKLDTIDALDIVLGSQIRKTDDIDDNLSTWVQLNRKAYNLILDHLDHNNLAYVAGALSPNLKRNGLALWDLLRKHYQADDFVNKTLSFSQFSEIKYENDINLFVNHLRAAVQKMQLVGFKLEEESTIILSLAKLPAQFDYLKKSTDYKGKLIEYLFKKLEQNEAQDRIWSIDLTSSGELTTPSALYNNKLTCDHCKRPGHNINSCWIKYPSKRPPPFNANKEDSAHFITF